MPAPYFTKLIDTYSPTGTGIGPYQTKALTCPTPGAGMRDTIKGITLSGWLCGVGTQVNFAGSSSQRLGMDIGASTESGGLTVYANSEFSRWGPGTMARDHQEPGIPFYNQTIDGFNYAAHMFHYYAALNFETGETQLYINDLFTHITFNVWGGGRLIVNNSTSGNWQILPCAMIGYRPGIGMGTGDIWMIDEYHPGNVIANRRQFINADLTSTILPADGHVVLDGHRVVPQTFFRALPSSTNPNDFLVNSGTGPAWTVTPSSPAITLPFHSCLTTTFVGEEPPPVEIPPPVQAATTAWTLEPDWINGVTERLQWKTDVLLSQYGLEQRRRLRNSPRRQIETQFTLIADDRRLYDAYMIGPAAGIWVVPLWWDRTVLFSPATAGDTTILCDTRWNEFAVGGAMMLLGKTPFVYETAFIAEVTSTSLTLQTPLTRSWPLRSKVYPTRKCYLTGQTPQGTRKADDAYQVQLQFTQVEINDFPEIVPPDTFNDVPVLRLMPNEANDLTSEYRRVLVEFDNEMSVLPTRFDSTGNTFAAQQFNYMVIGGKALSDLKGLLYFLQGKLVPIIVPTFFRDMELLHGEDADASTIEIRRSGYSDYIGLRPGRRWVGFFFKDGTYIIRLIAAFAAASDDMEQISFTEPFGRAVYQSLLLRICFVAFCRQDQDEIELLHHTDIAGPTTMGTTFVTILDGRDASAYDTDVFNGSFDQSSFSLPQPEDPQIPDVPLDAAGDPPVLVQQPDHETSDGGGGDDGGDGGDGSDGGDSGGGGGEGRK